MHGAPAHPCALRPNPQDYVILGDRKKESLKEDYLIYILGKCSQTPWSPTQVLPIHSQSQVLVPSHHPNCRNHPYHLIIN